MDNQSEQAATLHKITTGVILPQFTKNCCTSLQGNFEANKGQYNENTTLDGSTFSHLRDFCFIPID